MEIQDNRTEKISLKKLVGKIAAWYRDFSKFIKSNERYMNDPLLMQRTMGIKWIVENDWDGFLSDPVVEQRIGEDSIKVNCNINKDWISFPHVAFKCNSCGQIVGDMEFFYGEYCKNKENGVNGLAFSCDVCNKLLSFEFHV